MTDTTDITVRKNTETHRYEGSVGNEQVGFAEYRDEGDVVVMPHTVVPERFGGRGYASEIVRFALADIRAAGKKVNPVCPFVAAWLDMHPNDADLRA